MKRLSKILTLVLSLALIIGAVAVIASAQASEDNLIEFSVNGTVDSNVTTYEAALAAIRKGNVGGADYRIKLLGDLTVTTAFDLSDNLCNVVGTDTAGAGDDRVKRKTVIDLNGYDVDATAVDTVLFKLQRAERSVTVTGSGNITLGNYGFVQTISGANASVEGTGFGIHITENTDSPLYSFVSTVESSRCKISFKNTDIALDGKLTQNETKYFFQLINSALTMTNCRVSVDYAVNFTAAVVPSPYVFAVQGASQVALYNTSVTTSLNGLYQGYGKSTAYTGIDTTYNGKTDNFVLIMESSSLTCEPSRGSIDYYLAFNEEFQKQHASGEYHEEGATTCTCPNKDAATFLRTILFGRHSAKNDGSMYIKDSYVGANYRMISGNAEDESIKSPGVITFDHSTLEHIDKHYKELSLSITGSGQGVFERVFYADFINGSTIKLNQSKFKAGNSSAKTDGTTYVGVASTGDEVGTYCVDLAVGTRLDKNATASADIPTGTSLIRHKDGYYYVADAALAATLVSPSAVTQNASPELSRESGLITKNFVLEGRYVCYKWGMPTSQEDLANVTLGSKVDSLTIDGNTVTSTGDEPFIRLGKSHGAGTNATNSVSVISFDFYPSEDGAVPLYMSYTASISTQSFAKYGTTVGLKANGKVTNSNAVFPGMWNNMTVITDLHTGNYYIYLNGTLFGSDTMANITEAQSVRVRWKSETAATGAFTAFSNVNTYAFKDYIGGEFNASDYLSHYSYADGSISVGNTSYGTLDEALVGAKKADSYVTVSDTPVTGTAVQNVGYIYSKIGALDVTADASKIITNPSDGVYRINSTLFSITYDGTTQTFDAEGDLVTEIENRADKAQTVTLYDNVTIARKFDARNGGSSNKYLRSGLTIDLNGNTLTFDYDSIGNTNFLQTARGTVTIKNGNIKQVASSDITAAIFYVHFGNAYLKLENVNAEVYFLATLSSNSGHNPYVVVNDSTITSLSETVALFEIQSHGDNSANAEFTANGSTFYTDYLIYDTDGTNASVVNLNGCTVVTSDGKAEFVKSKTELFTDVITYTDCTLLGTAFGVSVFNGSTTAYGYTGTLTTTDEGSKIAYANNTVEHNGKNYSTRICSTTGNTLTATFNGLMGSESTVINYLEGNDPLDFTDLCSLSEVELNPALKIVPDGTWTMVGNGAYDPGYKLTYTEAFANNGAFTNLAMADGFNICFYVSSDYYSYLSESTKNNLTSSTVKIGEKEYYRFKETINRDANEAYTKATFTVTLAEGEYTHDVRYDVTVADYLDAAITVTTGEDRILVYNIIEYLDNAYRYFETVDDASATTLSDLVAVWHNLGVDLYREAPDTDYSALIGKGSISVNLTANPTFVVKANEAGTVSFAGKTYPLNANTDLYITAKAREFINVLTVSLESGATATYCLDDYARNVRNVETDEIYTEELKALVESFYSYVLYAARDLINVGVDEDSLDLSGISFRDATRAETGKERSIFVNGRIPEGVTVVYEGNGKIKAGTYTVTAKFYLGDIYLEGKDKTATMTIKTPDTSFAPTATVTNKNGTDGTVTYVIDDGDVTSAKNAVELQKSYGNLKFTFAIPTVKFAELTTVTDEKTGKLLYLMDNGRYTYERHEEAIETWISMLEGANGHFNEIASHSHTSAYWGWHDNGGEMNYLNNKNVDTANVITGVFPVGSITKELYASKQILQEIFGEYEGQYGTSLIVPGIGGNYTDTYKDGVFYPSCYNAFEDLFLEAVLNGSYIGSRYTFQSITAANAQSKVIEASELADKTNRLNTPSFMIYSSNSGKGANSTFEEWKLYIDAALEVGGWATFCLHNVCNTGKYYNLDREYADMLFSYTDKENIWVAGYTEALMYYSEWSTASAFAEFIDGRIYVNLTDGEDDGVFTAALTVKVTVPDSWTEARIGDKTLSIMTDEGGESYVYIDIVPDSGEVIISGN